MFNPKEYWEKKQERKRLQEEKGLNPSKAIAFLSRFFYRERAKATTEKGHTRSPKERRMRQIRHQSMMRNQP